LVGLHGRIVLIGYHQSHGGMRAVNMQQWNYKAIDVVNGHARRVDEKVAAMWQGIDLMQQGHLITVPLGSVNLQLPEFSLLAPVSGAFARKLILL